MSDKTIIPFPSRDGDVADLLHVQKPDKAFCRHQRVELDEKNRTIECGDCGTLLEPFDWALRWADKLSRENQQVIQMRKERASLLKSLEVLRLEERNTKARLKRARESAREAAFTQQEVTFAKAQLRQFMEGEA